jgi:hypothetical protein
MSLSHSASPTGEAHAQNPGVQREQTKFAAKAMHGLWPAHGVAQKLGQKLGQRFVLQ